jgi:hypothetical protein
MERYVGNGHQDGLKNRGWFVGCFIEPTDAPIRTTSAFEVKWCVCQAGDKSDKRAQPKDGTTLVLLVSGRLRLAFADGEVLLERPSDYALWNGGVEHTWTAEADSVVVAFRSPSTA